MGFTLNDGSSCKVGTNNFNNSWELPETLKLTKIEVVLSSPNPHIGQIVFHDKSGIVKKLGSDQYANGTKEVFELAENERWIGCELEHSTAYLMGITLLKWKV
jgi:hypothetical protein